MDVAALVQSLGGSSAAAPGEGLAFTTQGPTGRDEAPGGAGDGFMPVLRRLLEQAGCAGQALAVEAGALPTDGARRLFMRLAAAIRSDEPAARDVDAEGGEPGTAQTAASDLLTQLVGPLTAVTPSSRAAEGSTDATPSDGSAKMAAVVGPVMTAAAASDTRGGAAAGVAAGVAAAEMHPIPAGPAGGAMASPGGPATEPPAGGMTPTMVAASPGDDREPTGPPAGGTGGATPPDGARIADPSTGAPSPPSPMRGVQDDRQPGPAIEPADSRPSSVAAARTPDFAGRVSMEQTGGQPHAGQGGREGGGRKPDGLPTPAMPGLDGKAPQTDAEGHGPASARHPLQAGSGESATSDSTPTGRQGHGQPAVEPQASAPTAETLKSDSLPSDAPRAAMPLDSANEGRPLAGTHAGPPAPGTADADLRRAVMDQLVEKAVLRSSGDRSEMRIQLKPDVLGDVRMHIVSENNHLVVRMIAEKAAVKEIIDTHIHHLKAELDKQGLTVEKIEVLVDADDDQRPQREPFSQMSRNGSHGRRSPGGQQRQEQRTPPASADGHDPELSDERINYFA